MNSTEEFTEGASGSATSDKAWAKRKTDSVVGGGSGFTQSVYTTLVAYQPPGMTVEEATERLFATFVDQGIEMPEEGAPDRLKARLAEHNRRVRAAKSADSSPAVNQPNDNSDPTSAEAPDIVGSPTADDNGAMTAVTREEIDAKLEAVRSDMRAGNAELIAAFQSMRADVADMRAGVLTEVAGVRGEIAGFRGQLAEVRGEVTREVSGLRAEMANHTASVAGQIGGMAGQIGGIQGALDGVKTSLTTVQWLVGTLLAAAALYVSVAQFLTPPSAPASQQPIIINVPASTAAPAQPAKP